MIVRGRSLQLVITAAAVLCLAVFIVAYLAVSKPARPNIILISIDTLRADHLGCYGHGRPTSSNIDQLAEQGVQFLQTFSQSPKTAPSHMTIMTSLYPEVHGVENWNQRSERTALKPRRRLHDSIPTLAEVLKREGYRTAAFTGGANVDALLGFDKGFDLYMQREERGRIDDAVSWLKKNQGERFFLFYHDYIVHDPYLPPKPYTTKFDAGYDGKILDTVLELLSMDPSSEKVRVGIKKTRIFWDAVDRTSARDVAFLKALYDGAIQYMDERMIRPLIEAVREAGRAEDTLIIFTSDHGEAFHEHANFVHDDVYRETLHVPLILVYPGFFPENVKVDQPVRSIDIMPTVLDLLDIEAGFLMQGESLLPAIRGAKMDLWCYSTYPKKPLVILKSLRNEAFSYVFTRWSDKKKTRTIGEFLFNRKEDQREDVNVILSNEAVIQRFKRMVSGLEKANSKITFSGEAREIRPGDRTMRKLQDLGYVK